MTIRASLHPVLCLFAIAAAAQAQTFIEIPGSPFPTGLSPVAVAAGYFTDSGTRISTDLVVLNRDGNSVTVLQQSGTGYRASTHGPYPVGVGPVSFTVADFDSNGLLDLAVANSDGTVIIRSRAYANLLYMGFLRRTPDPAGLTYWNGILTAGNPLSGAIYGFINGPEYLNRLAAIVP